MLSCVFGLQLYHYVVQKDLANLTKGNLNFKLKSMDVDSPSVYDCGSFMLFHAI